MRGADAEPDAAAHATVEPGNRLGPNAASVEVLDQGAHRAQFEVAPEDDPDHLGLLRHDHELLVDAAVAERNRAPDPDALALGGRDLVAHPFPDHLPFELGEGEQHIEGEPAHAVVVLNDWVTDTKDTACWSNSSTSLAKSA